MPAKPSFERLLAFLERLPAIDLPAGRKSISHHSNREGFWSVQFRLNTAHTLAWRHVQELSFVLNWVSVEEPLPTVFKPYSPPPYLNGGVEFLRWEINNTHPDFTPDLCAEWLEGRLPNPVDDPSRWKNP